MYLFALDPGVRSGWAEGEAGTLPYVGAVILKQPRETLQKAADELAKFLADRWDEAKPDLLVIEHWMNPAANKSSPAVVSSLLFAGAARGMAMRYGVPVEEPYPATVRKHFIGRIHAGERARTNLMILQRAITLGYLPRGCTDWDRANASALFDWAAAHKARKPPKELVLFGERK